MNVFESLIMGARVQGLVPGQIVEIVQSHLLGEGVLKVVFRKTDGGFSEQLIFRSDAEQFTLHSSQQHYPFDGNAHHLRLVSEAYRIRLAHLFDPYLALHISQVEPLPHQITAVYGEMLTRQPLRFLLADDPGAGKTVMAGLFIKELLIRDDLERCLIVSPGGLVEQWQDELAQKFGLEFQLLTRERIGANREGDPFNESGYWIVRMDMLSRNPDLQDKLERYDWDLVVVDEAHRMSATVSGGEPKYTKRFRLGQRLAERARHLLLMTATPHNGKEAEFQIFMSLLDQDRFEGKTEDGSPTVDTADLMRRLTKEQLMRFDGRPLFPERRSYTVQYPLSGEEEFLYRTVTDYVRDEMNRAERLDEGRKVNVGFALQTLQRRLASSPEAIYQSLKRRRERLEARLNEEKHLSNPNKPNELPSSEDWEDYDELGELGESDVFDLEQTVLDRATAAATLQELQAEIVTLQSLELRALGLRSSGRDTKWKELSALLQDPIMTSPSGERRKLIIFSEARDTLRYLTERIVTQLGKPEAVAVIHGGVSREARRDIVERFNFGGDLKILIANDAAGEGLNLQTAHLMVNYDLPWNPNRLEQRFGRIHRIGQEEVCHLWNLVAEGTREGEVYARLLQKLEIESAALGGRVFDVLGKLFQNKPLRDLLVEAIRYGDQPETRARLHQVVEGAVDRDAISSLLEERALGQERMDLSRVQHIREQMDRAEARKLQPHFIASFFLEAFGQLEGKIVLRETGRYSVSHVPSALRNRSKLLSKAKPLLPKYDRICFDKAYIQGPVNEPPNERALEQKKADFVYPGHPLLDVTLDLILEQYGETLQRGAILVDPQDQGEMPRVLFYLEHEVRDARPSRQARYTVISQRLMFLEMDWTGKVQTAGAAPYLDYRPPTPLELETAQILLKPDKLGNHLGSDLESRILAHATQSVVPTHLEEVRALRLLRVDKVERAVRARLTKEIHHWDYRAIELAAQEKAGKNPRLNSRNAEMRVQDLSERLERRMNQINLERNIISGVPQVRGVALIVPQGWLDTQLPSRVNRSSVDTAARKRIEQSAMQAVIQAEIALGRTPKDVSAERGLGYDLESKDASGRLYFIEVKGRYEEGDTVTLTKNELLASKNALGQFRLALVRVIGGVAQTPRYLSNYAFPEPSFAEESRTFNWKALDQLAFGPH